MPGFWNLGGGAAAGTSPLSILDRMAKAFGRAIGVDFSQSSPFTDDFAIGIVLIEEASNGGTLLFSEASANIGGNGQIKLVTTAPAAGAKFVYVSSVDMQLWITDAASSAYYVGAFTEVRATQPPPAGNGSLNAIGIFQSAALTGNSAFVLFGNIGGAADPTKYGFSTYNLATQTFHNGGTILLPSTGQQHFLAIGHDPVTHMLYGYVDGELADSISDAHVAGLGGMTAYAVATEGDPTGFTQADCVYSVQV